MLDSQFEVARQAKHYLKQIDDSEYQEIAKPYFSGSAGMHMRHIIDHYLALQRGVELGLVDYNKRNRYSNIEKSTEVALTEWLKIEQWLTSICDSDLNAPMLVISEVSLHKTQSVQVQSSLARELVFVSSHAIHHFSLLGVMQSIKGKALPENFGVAPATVTFQRAQA